MGLFNFFKHKDNDIIDVIFSTAEGGMKYYEKKYKSNNKGANFEIFMFSLVISWDYCLNEGKINTKSNLAETKITKLCDYSKALGYNLDLIEMTEFYMARYKFFKKDINGLRNSNYPQTKQYLPELSYRLICNNQLLRNETDVLEADWNDNDTEYLSRLVEFTGKLLDVNNWTINQLMSKRIS